MAPPRRALISIPGVSRELYSGGDKTGMFVTEALHPFQVLTAAGFAVDIASESGTYTADQFSLNEMFLSGADLAAWEDPKSAFRTALASLKPASALRGEDYGLFYAAAGHAAMIDYPTATNLQEIASKVWARGGVVSTVCHGPAILPGVVDDKTGDSVVKGRTVTGFTTEAEHTLGIYDILIKWEGPLVEDGVKELGGTYKRGAGIWDDFHLVDGRLVTGQNPQSATSTAQAAVEVFEKL